MWRLNKALNNKDILMLIDTHCHLDFTDFEADFDDVIARAHAAGVARMVSISTRVRQFAKLAAIIEKYPSVYATIGTHPCNVMEETDVTVEELLEIVKAYPKVVGIGEAGLDFFHHPEHAQFQDKSFRIHIEAARQSGLPIVIHARECDDAMEALLVEEMRKGAFGAILHCYASGLRLAQVGIELGFYISFSGIVTFKNAPIIQQVATMTPADKILVETDAPYLAPAPNRGKRNEPAFCADTAKFVANLRRQNFDEFAAQTTQNASRLFARMGQFV